ncbi:response regulator [Massilia sp. CF038]|uniref:response regulator n=1 Tax=Massilia sp. CF038 TaxID=1881045 RepID=UPI00091FC64D|nr:response regulator [Massilia sp. CF038]SHH54009.1 Response regulator receiver domain-containing protein [Massilia sp. CF038]
MSELNFVLYVEDDPDIQMVAQMALEVVGGLALRACSSGREAVDAAQACQPDLILLDVMMPDMDGPTTLAALRQLPGTANTPVIFMTAKVQAAEVAHYKTLGAIGVIAKPFDPMQLAQQVRQLWQEAGL